MYKSKKFKKITLKNFYELIVNYKYVFYLLKQI